MILLHLYNRKQLLQLYRLFLLRLEKYQLDASTRLFIDKETFPDEWYLDSISVSEDFRGQGIGSRLLEALPKLAKKANRSVIGLSVDEKNPKAKKLYERHGFKVVH